MQTPNHGGNSYPPKNKPDFATADAKRKISNGSDSLAPLAWISIAISYKNSFLSSLQLEVPKCPCKLQHVYLFTHNNPKTVISGFCHGINEIFAHLGAHAVLIGFPDP